MSESRRPAAAGGGLGAGLGNKNKNKKGWRQPDPEEPPPLQDDKGAHGEPMHHFFLLFSDGDV
jgi:hypothetical protein